MNWEEVTVMTINRKEDSNNEEIYGVCMEVAGIESCGFGVGPMEIPRDNNNDKEN